MKIITTALKDRTVINISDIPVDSSLGLLAYGDIGFEAWRKLKKYSKTDEVDESE